VVPPVIDRAFRERVAAWLAYASREVKGVLLLHWSAMDGEPKPECVLFARRGFDGQWLQRRLPGGRSD